MRFCNLCDDSVRQEARDALIYSKLHVALRSKRGVRRDCDSKSLAEGDQLLLGEVRVQLDLQNLRLNLCVSQYIEED